MKAFLLPIILLLLISACASEKKQDINEQKETK
jgi:uncharacterized protein YcfL